MKLDMLHSGRLSYRKKSKHVTPGDLTKVDTLAQWIETPNAAMPGMHEVPHMDGTAGNVPKPGKPKWHQRPY